MILDWFIARATGRAVLAALFVLTVLFLLLDFLESARHLLSGKGTALEVLAFYALKVPGVVYLMAPIALVVGTAAGLAELGRRRELSAIAAAGVSPGRLFRPVLGIGLTAATLGFLLGELAVPCAVDRLEVLMQTRFGRVDSSWRFFRSHAWYRGEGERLFRLNRRSADGSALGGVTVFDLGPDFDLERRLNLGEVTRADGRWRAQSVLERRFQDGHQIDFRTGGPSEVELGVGPERFRDLSGRPEQKSLLELSEEIELLGQRGLDARELELSFHRRFAFPLLGVSLLAFAFPGLARPDRRRTLAGALLEATGLVLFAYLAVALANAAVAGGLLGPATGAWSPVLAVAALAALAWRRGQRLGRIA